jgi:hypothetical protein
MGMHVETTDSSNVARLMGSSTLRRSDCDYKQGIASFKQIDQQCTLILRTFAGRLVKACKSEQIGGNMTLPFKIAYTPSLNLSTSGPFNITTGTDWNADTNFNARPALATFRRILQPV